MRILFDWDPRKAESNRVKHGVSFEDAMGVFNDPLALTIFDADHSQDEDRWVTVGMANASRLLLVIHTHVEIAEDEVLVRIISARIPTRREALQYREGTMR